MDRAGAADCYLSAVDEGLKGAKARHGKAGDRGYRSRELTWRPNTTAARRPSTVKSRPPPPPPLLLPLPLVPLGSLLTEGSPCDEVVPLEAPEPLPEDTDCTHEAVCALAAMDVRLHAEN